MIREPYIGMPITIGCSPANRPGHPAPPSAPSMPPVQAPPSMPPGSSQMTGFDGLLLGTLPIAMAYVPMQQWNSVYEPAAALRHGTLFPELNLPFEGGRKR